MKTNITGIMVYYYKVCQRKLWYHAQGISMEQNNENVSIGKAIDEEYYGDEDKHINIHNIINIDFIRSEKVVHEVKKSKAIEPASIEQVKYYLWYLKQEGVEGLHGILNYPLLRKSIDVILTEEDIERIPKILEEIRAITLAPTPPPFKKLKICKNCAFCDICMI